MNNTMTGMNNTVAMTQTQVEDAFIIEVDENGQVVGTAPAQAIGTQVAGKSYLGFNYQGNWLVLRRVGEKITVKRGRMPGYGYMASEIRALEEALKGSSPGEEIYGFYSAKIWDSWESQVFGGKLRADGTSPDGDLLRAWLSASEQVKKGKEKGVVVRKMENPDQIQYIRKLMFQPPAKAPTTAPEPTPAPETSVQNGLEARVKDLESQVSLLSERLLALESKKRKK